ncbi:hypothetical protein D9619_012919 [Psilocybe cf. subviscida]|uniref:Uncharacterized protein n=1 Tax=Psilocybe cf. subviscida TaxID=2480587 RepID=A0A8H5F570_9AGAR|nr:hypothetical protein D9619_012919 [Psilocybe cf. subviscida]
MEPTPWLCSHSVLYPANAPSVGIDPSLAPRAHQKIKQRPSFLADSCPPPTSLNTKEFHPFVGPWALSTPSSLFPTARFATTWPMTAGERGHGRRRHQPCSGLKISQPENQ